MLACSAKIQQNGAKCKSAKMGAEGPNPKKRKIRTGRRQRGVVVSEQPADDDEKGGCIIIQFFRPPSLCVAIETETRLKRPFLGNLAKISESRGV